MRWVTTMAATLVLASCFSALAQGISRFDIVITEIFADPTPSRGLPSFEFVEIMNVSPLPHNLKDYKIGNAGSSGTITSDMVLQPGSIAILCSNSGSAALAAFGTVMSVSNFPSFDNNTDMIVLRSNDGSVIHAVSYNQTWYKSDLKSDGGWSLEMIDTENPCEGANNWSASMNPSGGTPGKINSVTGTNADQTAPLLLRTFTPDSNTIVAVFSEPLDSLRASNTVNYRLGKDVGHPLQATPVSPLFSEVKLTFAKPMIHEMTYELTVSDIMDCNGNTVEANRIVKAGLPSEPDTVDIVVNELLFNPKGGGFDFIELYNKSSKVLDLQHLLCSNRTVTGGFSNITPLTNIPYLLFPGEFIVFTEDKSWLTQNYVPKDYSTIHETSSLPSLPDDRGTLVITSKHGQVIDEIHYDSKWHFALLENQEGISLERINYNSPTQDKDNWTSAASTAGFGTPGYQNSQFKSDATMLQAIFSVNPKMFSPDNDGFDDIATINYQVATTGFVANITIFDANGRPVKYLVKNATLALQGNFRWDGLDDKFQRLPAGIYIVFTEIFNMQGKTRKFRNAIALAKKF